VDLKAPALQQAILKKYHWRERHAEALKTKAIIQAAKGADGVAETLRDFLEALFPEMGQSRESFRDRARKEMEEWQKRVIEISMGPDHGPTGTARVRKTEDVKEELRKLRPVPRAGKRRSRRR